MPEIDGRKLIINIARALEDRLPSRDFRVPFGRSTATLQAQPRQDSGSTSARETAPLGDGATIYVGNLPYSVNEQGLGALFLPYGVPVDVRQRASGGLLLSSSGFANATVRWISSVERHGVRLGGEEKIVTLCRTWVQRTSGIWEREKDLHELLWVGTL